MHSKLLIAGLLLFGTLSCNSDHPVHENRASGIAAEIHDPASKKVLVVSHRGDWRNYPENSLPALRSAIDRGVDIVEIDLKMTSDSVLVLMHDARIDRTTTGRGRSLCGRCVRRASGRARCRRSFSGRSPRYRRPGRWRCEAQEANFRGSCASRRGARRRGPFSRRDRESRRRCPTPGFHGRDGRSCRTGFRRAATLRSVVSNA